MKVTVIGDGAWGTALALVAAGNGHGTTLWGPFPDNIATMRERRENVQFLPGPKLPDALDLTADLNTAMTGPDMVILASPCQFMRSILEQIAALGVSGNPLFVNVAKGIEVSTLHRPQQIVSALLGQVRYVVISGPSHAEEVSQQMPTAVVAASDNIEDSELVQTTLNSEFLRIYTSTDVAGVELGGALKNVFALAAGICDGMGFGDNSKAALLTRGIVEMARLGKALGGRPETFSGLSGIGDLIATCISRHSRNRHVGECLGQGQDLAEIENGMGKSVAEGVKTAVSAYRLARNHAVDVPIITEVYAALYDGKDPRTAARDLMTREPKPEKLVVQP